VVCQQYVNGKHYFGSLTGGLSGFDGNKIINFKSKFLIVNTALVVFNESKNNRNWIGGWNGLEWIENGNHTFRNNNNGLPHWHIQYILPDSKQNVWVGMEGGLSRWGVTKFNNYDSTQGLTKKT